MADFIDFPLANCTLAPGDGPLDKDGSLMRDGVKISSMRVFRDVANKQLVSCWKLSPEEISMVLHTGCVYLFVLGDRHPPVHITGIAFKDEGLADIVPEHCVGDEMLLGDQLPPDPEASPTADGGPPTV